MASISVVRLPGLDHRQGVPHPKLAFEVQGGAHSCQAPLHHDSNAVTQRICLLHAVRRQHDGPVSPVLLDDVPCESGHKHKPKVSPQSAALCPVGMSPVANDSPAASVQGQSLMALLSDTARESVLDLKASLVFFLVVDMLYRY